MSTFQTPVAGQSLPSTTRRVCLFGGSFDPIHSGHLAMAQAALEQCQLDEVVFLPANISPFKQDCPPAFPAAQRVWLLHHAVDTLPGMSVSELDLQLPPPSWTWRLVERWQQDHPQEELYWLMGTDQWDQLHRWARYEQLVQNLRFIVYHRGEHLPAERPGVRVSFITANHPASSSGIRECLLNGKAIPEGWMPQPLIRAAEVFFWMSARFRLDNRQCPIVQCARMNPPAIAIDGPAASGKSTVARLLAERLGYTFINTGAMYRAVTWYVLQKGINPTDTQAVCATLHNIPLSFGKQGSCSCVLCDHRVLNEELTDTETNNNVSAVASIPEVRALLVQKQREYNANEPVVMEGRDIGTVVFPNTPFKYFVTASEEVRAARRAAQGITDSIAERDRKDSQRACAPLTQARDAKLVDTSDMTITEVVDLIAKDILDRLAAH